MTRFSSRIRLTGLATLLLMASAQAMPVKIFVSSGTGFFITSDGYALTNLHVVKNCERITLTSEKNKYTASIVGRDVSNDLALLKSDAMVGDVAHFRRSTTPLEVDDRVIIVGYPGEAFRTGDTVTREAQVLATTGPKGEEKWLQLSDVISEGNSGGPLLDGSGNVSGVVSAKALIYTYRQDAPEEGVTSRSGIAINVPTIEKFLEDNHVRFRSADSGIYLSADRITDQAHRYVVNVLCQMPSRGQN